MNAYLAVLRAPGVLRATAAQLLARLPLGMLSLAILLHVEALTGSFATAGLVVGCLTLGEAVAMPVSGRLVPRWGARRVLLVCASAHAAALASLGAVGPTPWLLAVLATCAGASVPPVMPAVRALYPFMVSRDGVRALFALDTTAQELIWIVGPVGATMLAASGSTALGLLVASATTLVGSVWFAATPGMERLRTGRNHARLGGVLTDRSVAVAMVTSAALMGSFTALEVAVIAQHEHDPLVAGAVIAVPSAASLIGGLAWGHRKFDLVALTVALAVVAAGTAGAGLATGTVVQLVFLFVSGLGFAPALAALYYMVSKVVAERSATEAFGWLQTGALVGAAGGSAVGGALGEATGPSGAYAAATAIAVAAALVPLAARALGPLPGLHRSGDGADEDERQPVTH